MKTCFKCGLSKDEDEFYIHLQMKDGLLGKCKSCARIDTENRRKEKEQDPEWSSKEAERHRNKSAKARKLGIASKAKQEHHDAWAKRNPSKVYAQHEVKAALKSGFLKKQPCEVCGLLNVQAHHPNYLMPLSVEWLCPKHHLEKHRKK